MEVKRNNLYQVPHSKLKLIDGFNDREDYGTMEEMNELAESIHKVGVMTPLKGYKDGEFYVIISGHRRFKAGEIIKKKYKQDTVYPFVPYPIGTTKKDYLIDTLLTNSGKDLTPLEKASTVSKLLEEMVTYKQISEALGGVSDQYVRNLARLWQVPEPAKKLIRDGHISATLVMGYLKAKGSNLEELIAEAQKQAAAADKPKKGSKPKGKGKKATVTAKTLPKKKKGLTAVDMFNKYREQSEKIFGSKEAENAYTIMCAVLDNKISYKQIVDFFAGVIK